MIFYDNFVGVSSVVFVISFILAMGLLCLSDYLMSKICKILGIVFVLVSTLTFGFSIFAVGVFNGNPVISIEPNKTYLDTEASTTEVHIRPLDETPYFLVQENGEYIYRSTDTDSKGNSKIDASKCEFKFSDEKPGISIQSITTKCHADWFFLYDDKTEQEQKYLITIPSRESILNLDE